MPLFDVTNTRASKVKPEDAEEYEVLAKLKRDLDPKTFSRILKTVDEAIDSLNPSRSSSLVWTRSAALFGHGSQRPHKQIEHLWKNIESVVGPDKLALKAVGGFLRWRISLRDQTWLVYRSDSDKRDPDTGKLITISEYWIDDTFAPPPPKARAPKTSLQDLANAWGARMV